MNKPTLRVVGAEPDESPARDIATEQDPNLEAVLDAWQTATRRLERTHETLRGEVRRLTRELEEKNIALVRKNRLADLGQMASHVAHEVRNSLVPLTLYLSLLRRSAAGDSAALGLLDKIESGFTALEATVNDMLHFTSQREPARRAISVRSFVDDLCQSLAPQLEAQGIHLDLDIPTSAVISADADMLRRAVLNLLLNALDVMPEGGEVSIIGYDGPRGFELEIGDTGPGVPDQAQRRLFEPFFSTKSNGSGLGLAIVHRIAEVHGGSVTVQNGPEGGAAFTLRIPRTAMEAAA